MFRILPFFPPRRFLPAVLIRLCLLLPALTATPLCGTATAADLDGQDAVSRAQDLFAKLGMQKKMPLETLGNRHYITKTKCWVLTFKEERGHVTVVLDAHTGRALFIQTFPVENAARNHKPTPETVAHAATYLRTLGYDKEARRRSALGYGNGFCTVTFDRTLHGLLFFNLNPTYGHTLWFDPENGALLYFCPAPALPEANAWKPRVKSEAASAKINAWAQAHAGDRHKVSLPAYLQEVSKAELGYWKFQHEETARLVWRVNRYLNIRGKLIEQGAYQVFVDALTGEIVEPDDPASGVKSIHAKSR